MKTWLLGLLAIPVIFTLVSVPSAVQACGGGNLKPETYFNGKIVAAPGTYNATPFSVSHDTGPVSIMTTDSSRVTIIRDSDMFNYTHHGNYTAVYNGTSRHYVTQMSAGRYWVIVDNRGENAELAEQVDISLMLPKSTCVPEPNPFLPIPDVSSGFVALAMVIAAVMTVIIKKR